MLAWTQLSNFPYNFIKCSIFFSSSQWAPIQAHARVGYNCVLIHHLALEEMGALLCMLSYLQVVHDVSSEKLFLRELVAAGAVSDLTGALWSGDADADTNVNSKRIPASSLFLPPWACDDEEEDANDDDVPHYCGHAAALERRGLTFKSQHPLGSVRELGGLNFERIEDKLRL